MRSINKKRRDESELLFELDLSLRFYRYCTICFVVQCFQWLFTFVVLEHTTIGGAGGPIPSWVGPQNPTIKGVTTVDDLPQNFVALDDIAAQEKLKREERVSFIS